MKTIEEIEHSYLKSKVPKFSIGDTVDVSLKIIEGDKERAQVFSGTVIARKGTGLSETFTVRRIVEGEGVERVFPIHSPNVTGIKVKRHGKVRRAKLYYLRQRAGKGTRVVQRQERASPEKQEKTEES